MRGRHSARCLCSIPPATLLPESNQRAFLRRISRAAIIASASTIPEFIITAFGHRFSAALRSKVITNPKRDEIRVTVRSAPLQPYRTSYPRTETSWQCNKPLHHHNRTPRPLRLLPLPSIGQPHPEGQEHSGTSAEHGNATESQGWHGQTIFFHLLRPS